MKTKNYAGFTLVETLLVLGIAGLIFAMVFIALPGLTAARRDSERQDDVMLLINKLKNYQANNNRGALPGTDTLANLVDGSGSTNKWDDFYADYLGSSFSDPDGVQYKLGVVRCNAEKPDMPCKDSGDNEISASISNGTFEANDYTMHVIIQAKCDGTTALRSTNPRNVAVVYRLERADVFCSNS